MAELSITPKRSARNLPNICDKTKTEARERKRNILYLILDYLNEYNLQATAETLQNEAQLNNQYQICENVDLDIILQEYQSYYYIKFQKQPKIVRKVQECENVTTDKDKKRNSGRQRTLEKKEQNVSPLESQNFHFDIISLASETSNISQDISQLHITENLSYKFKNYSNEWQEMAKQIIKEFIPKNQGITWNHCIGLNNTIEKLKEATIYPSLYPELFNNLQTWKGLLLYGPPGTGKTLLAKALASEGFTTFINVTSSTFVSKWRGDSEKMIQVLFEVAKLSAPTTIFIDEIDALASTSYQLQHEASRRFKSELLTQIDGIASSELNIFILGSTNNPWTLDGALLRRFEKRILVDLPHEDQRRELLKHYIKEPNSIQKEEFQLLAERTEIFSGSDIKTLSKEVTMTIIRENIKEIHKGNNKIKVLRKITCSDVLQALKKIKPCTTIEDCKKYYEWKDKYGSW